MNNIQVDQRIIEWNSTKTDYPRFVQIQQIFQQCADKYAEQTAVIMPATSKQIGQRITYHKLDLLSGALCSTLKEYGVNQQTVVGLYVERSIDMVIAMLAILKAGATYLPLDPAYPKDRLLFMLKDAQAPIVLTQSHLADELALDDVIQCLSLAEIINHSLSDGDAPHSTTEGDATNLACILYTSGSTGRPKGVEVPHRSITRLVLNTDYTRFDSSRVFLQLVPISFDVAEFEIWGALLHGATTVLYPEHGIPDPQLLEKCISEYGVTTLWLTTSLFNTIIDNTPDILTGVNELLVGGEALSVPHIVKAQEHLPATQLINGYGPTESNITTTYRIPRPFDKNLKSVSIGRPIANSTIYILDEALKLVAVGDEGELYIGGDGLARGYLDRPDMTAEHFLVDPFSDEKDAKLYKTGDRARYLPDGNIEFIGRDDDQVKIDGHRIELGEIEAAIRADETVRDAGVVVHSDPAGHKRLVAYVAFEQMVTDTSALANKLETQLPDYMLPHHWFVLDSIPLTANGKLDRRALPTPEQQRPDLQQLYVAPKTELEICFAELWKSLLFLDRVGIHDNFFELGGSSLLSLQCVARLRKEHNISIPIVDLFQHPTIGGLCRYIEAKTEASTQPQRQKRVVAEQDGIAIIGMAGRFPGADSVDELWQALCNGDELLTRFDLSEIDAGVDEQLKNDPNYVPVRGVINQADSFDAAFFGISPREAEMMDPQQRVFLETVWHTLENAGYDTSRYSGLIGLYAGMNSNTYYANNVLKHPDKIQQFGEFQVLLANEKDYLTTRASYKLGLRGPSVSLYTACSTSLTAVCHAFEALQNRQCDMAMAGGVSIIVPQNSGYLYQEGGMFTHDGHCRPFDANATGTTFNSGVGLVMLKREQDARRDGDTIYAVIKGIGLNNDGSEKASFTAPSIDGQAAAVQKAMQQADFDPASVSYIETHGTGTPLGDPIEVAGLNMAFGKQKPNSCAIGSIKGNIGHLIHAAGVTGLIKTALALKNRTLPASINYTNPNPNIDFSAGPFFVNDRLTEWPAGDTPRRAGVSSFGVGGTNAHVMLEEAQAAQSGSAAQHPHQLLLLSARSESALQQACDKLNNYLSTTTEDLADIAYTLQVGRKAFNHRAALVCQDANEAAESLAKQPAKSLKKHQIKGGEPAVVFMFPGQGAQYINMGFNLYQHEAVFRREVDRCVEILKPLLGLDLLTIMHPQGDSEEAEQQLQQTVYTQPALFTIEYALARLWQSWGVQPTAMIGHSIGEFVAAALANVFSLEDALSLVAARARMMQERPVGTMLSVRLSADQVKPQLATNSSIAAINGTKLCVAAGPDQEMKQLQQQLEGQGVLCKVLRTSHAFHSPMMNPVVAPFLEQCRAIELSKPETPFVSTVTANWISDDQATDPEYWAKHLRETVRFADGVKQLWADDPTYLMLEVGPRTTTATLARQQATDKKQQIALSSLADNSENDREWISLLNTLGQLWTHGVTIDWQQFHRAEKRQRIPLPDYPFERKRFWLDAPSSTCTNESYPVVDTGQQLTNGQPMSKITTQATASRLPTLIDNIKEVMEDISGEDLASAENSMSFLELGFDSLVLTQASLALKNRFKVDITFRQLLEEFTNIDELADYFDATLPSDAFAPEVIAAPTPDPAASVAVPVVPGMLSMPQITAAPADASSMERIFNQQLQLMARQLEMLGDGAPAVQVGASPDSCKPTSSKKSEAKDESGRPHGPGAKIQRASSETLTLQQQKALDEYIKQYNAHTPKSKQAAQDNRRQMADPRTVSGFRPVWKEMVYPIVVERSDGSKLWDIDGNEYIDLACGFGSNMFGWQAPFIVKAVEKQLKIGYEIGPQTPLAGEVVRKVCQLTGNERAAFCNTGSEAVLASIRLARTVTGKNTLVVFSGAYHGIIDEMIVRGSASGRSLPAASGIPREMIENVIVLDYGTPESMAIIEAKKDELAGVLVETVQSRCPDLRPEGFLRQLRTVTEECGAALIFDEVITGFRVHPAGVQGYYDIRADMATYGKVVGGGMPVGLIAGKARFMDALDGGQWQYGDDSIPEIGVTFFAGTFVRHPLALAASNAVLDRLIEDGPALQEKLAEKTQRFADQVNAYFDEVGASYHLPYFTSFFYLSYPKEMVHGGLLYYLLRARGVHIWEGRPCFLTTAHTEEDIRKIIQAFKESIVALQKGGFLAQPPEIEGDSFDASKPPVPDARLGKDPQGNPAWYVEDPDRPGKYMQVKQP